MRSDQTRPPPNKMSFNGIHNSYYGIIENDLGMKLEHPVDAFTDSLESSVSLPQDLGTVESMRAGLLTPAMVDLVNSTVDSIPDMADAGE